MQHFDYDNMTLDEISVALKLDEEEKALMESIESGEWVSVPNVEEEMKRYQEMARAQIARQKIEVNLSLQDTGKIHNLAEQLGISVAAVVQEVMHKYLGGELIEASNPLNATFEENARDVARIGGS
jgi:predicted DNA binding CopG/RHH family protein